MKAFRSSESVLLNRVKTRVSVPRGSRLTHGIGDDCAIFRPRGGTEDLLFTTDLLLEDVHFRRKTHAAGDVGHKALARGLSDIAAMGGEPRFCLLSLAIPRWANEAWVDGFFRGFLALGEKTATPLAGGDLARADRFACDVVVCGAAPCGKALLRSGARPGDRIYVSGELGGAAYRLENGKRDPRLEPRLALGRFLRESGATAAMDLSDGLSIDLARLCTASRVSANITVPPIFRHASIEQALHGGEDYELLFTMPPRRHLPEQFQGLRLSYIGVIQKGRIGAVFVDGKRLQALGFDHFQHT